MISIARISKDIRFEGFMYGTPMTFLELGYGQDFKKADDLLTEIVKYPSPSGWLCIRGEEPTHTGMGALVKGLSTLGFKLEIEVSSDTPTPGWFQTCDRWIVIHTWRSVVFDVWALRPQDMVRFDIRSKLDIEAAEKAFETLKTFPGVKYLKIPALDSELHRLGVELVMRHARARIYGC